MEPINDLTLNLVWKNELSTILAIAVMDQYHLELQAEIPGASPKGTCSNPKTTLLEDFSFNVIMNAQSSVLRWKVNGDCYEVSQLFPDGVSRYINSVPTEQIAYKLRIEENEDGILIVGTLDTLVEVLLPIA